MKLFSAFLLSVGLIIAAPVAQAGVKNSHNSHDRAPAEQIIKGKNGSYKVITWEGNRKITTTYKPIGSRKVGLVGERPYGIDAGKGLERGGEYYTENGVKYFQPTKELKVEGIGSLND